jgi:hypothetical protein
MVSHRRRAIKHGPDRIKTMTKQYTPGPWAFRGDDFGFETYGRASFVGPDGVGIAAISTKINRTPEENRANARLIAAAPDMREALEAALSYIADLNGSEWIKGDHPAQADMRQRAKHLQSRLASIIYPGA